MSPEKWIGCIVIEKEKGWSALRHWASQKQCNPEMLPSNSGSLLHPSIWVCCSCTFSLCLCIELEIAEFIIDVNVCICDIFPFTSYRCSVYRRRLQNCPCDRHMINYGMCASFAFSPRFWILACIFHFNLEWWRVDMRSVTLSLLLLSGALL